MPLEDPRSPVSVTAITWSGPLSALASEWGDLWRRCPRATPFQAPEWALAWWREFGGGGLWVLLMRSDDGTLVGLAPLYLQTADGHRVVRLLGAGLSDYLDLLAAPGWETAVAEAAVAEIQAHPERWDEAEFQQLPADSALLGVNLGFPDEITAGEPCPVAALPPAGAAEGMGSARLRANLAADRRRLDRDAGPVTIEAAAASTLSGLIDELYRLHTARWQARGEAGVVAASSVAVFHRAAASGLFARGVARIYALRAAGRVLAVYYGFVHRSRAWYYLGGFDPAWRAYGVGSQVIAHAAAAAATEGATRFDFLRGREPYKYRWGARDCATFCRRLWSVAFRQRPSSDFISNRVGSHGPTVRSAA